MSGIIWDRKKQPEIRKISHPRDFQHKVHIVSTDACKLNSMFSGTPIRPSSTPNLATQAVDDFDTGHTQPKQLFHSLEKNGQCRYSNDSLLTIRVCESIEEIPTGVKDVVEVEKDNSDLVSEMKKHLVPVLVKELGILLEEKLAKLTLCKSCSCTCTQGVTQDNIHAEPGRQDCQSLGQEGIQQYGQVGTPDGTPTPCPARPLSKEHVLEASILYENITVPLDRNGSTSTSSSEDAHTWYRNTSFNVSYTQDMERTTLAKDPMSVVKPGRRRETPVSPNAHAWRRNNTLPSRIPRASHHTRFKEIRPQRSNKRDCMTKALQTNIEAIVDGVLFEHSELQDVLLADGCLTEDETDIMLKLTDRKDQIRFILMLIRGRDYPVLMAFLKQIKEHNVSVYKLVMAAFDKNVSAGHHCTQCALCRLVADVNVKYVIDALWAEEIVPASMYSQVIHTTLPSGAQAPLWRQVVTCINWRLQRHVQRQKVFGVLSETLRRKKHYEHIARALEVTVSRRGQLECECKIRYQHVAGHFPVTIDDSSMCVSTASSFSSSFSSCTTSTASSMEASRLVEGYEQVSVIPENEGNQDDKTVQRTQPVKPQRNKQSKPV